MIDARTLVPFDWETVLRLCPQNRQVRCHEPVRRYRKLHGEIVSRIMEECFDSLDAPVLKIGAKNGIAPQAHCLEKAFLPSVEEMVAAAKKIL